MKSECFIVVVKETTVENNVLLRNSGVYRDKKDAVKKISQICVDTKNSYSEGWATYVSGPDGETAWIEIKGIATAIVYIEKTTLY